MPSISALLTDPDGFFSRQSPSLKGPIAVVTIVAAVNVAASVIQFRFMSQLFENAGVGGGFARAFQAVSLVFVLVGPFVVWLLYAGLFQGISVLFDGDGEFSTTLAFAGWGVLPSIFGSVFTAAINYYRFNVRSVDVPAEMSQEAIQQFSQQLQQGPIAALSAVLGMVFTVWSGFLWTFAVKHARNLTVREAAISVAVPVAISLLLTARTLLVALGVL